MQEGILPAIFGAWWLIANATASLVLHNSRSGTLRLPPDLPLPLALALPTEAAAHLSRNGAFGLETGNKIWSKRKGKGI